MNWFFWAPSVLFVGIFLVIPLSHLFILGFQNISSSIFEDPLLLRVVSFTYLQALLSSLLCLLFGGLTAFAIKEWRIPGRNLLWKFSLICSSLPPLIIALGVLGVWGPGAPLARLLFENTTIFGWSGILLGHLFLNFAIPLRWIGLALKERDLEGEYTALSLGMKRFEVFRKITWLEIRTSIFSSWVLVFLYCSTSLFVVLFLGGGPRFTTLEVSLYEAIKLNLDSGKAVQIAVFQGLLGAIIFCLYLRLQREKKQLGSRAGLTIYYPRQNAWRWVGGACTWFVMALLFGTAFFSIFKDGILGWKFLNFTDLLHSSLFSLGIALSVAMVSLLISYPFLHWLWLKTGVKKKKLLSWILVLPQFFSVLVVALGLSVFFPWLRGGETFPYLGIVLSQSLFAIPLIQFPLMEGFQRLSKERFMISQTLGARAWQRWFLVELPAMRRSILLSILLAVGFSLGEVVSVLLFAPANVKTLSLGIFQAMSRYRFQEAHAYTVWLLIWILIFFGLAGSLEVERDE